MKESRTVLSYWTTVNASRTDTLEASISLSRYLIKIKAFLRRALCHKEMKNYDEALKDVEEALKLDKDKSALILKEEVTQIVQMEQRVTEIKDQVVDIDTKI